LLHLGVWNPSLPFPAIFGYSRISTEIFAIRAIQLKKKKKIANGAVNLVDVKNAPISNNFNLATKWDGIKGDGPFPIP
jgi:hypothetical protein